MRENIRILIFSSTIRHKFLVEKHPARPFTTLARARRVYKSKHTKKKRFHNKSTIRISYLYSPSSINYPYRMLFWSHVDCISVAAWSANCCFYPHVQTHKHSLDYTYSKPYALAIARFIPSPFISFNASQQQQTCVVKPHTSTPPPRFLTQLIYTMTA